MYACHYLTLIMAAVVTVQDKPAEKPEMPEPKVPAWAKDALWYQVDVPLFHNGDASNDPAEGPGGDLKGLQVKLPHLKTQVAGQPDLGVNAIYLTSLFARSSEDSLGLTRLRHVDDALGKAGSAGELKNETDDPKTWHFSETDKLFLGLVEAAHKAGIRVILDIALPGGSEGTPSPELSALMRRWLDPDADGNPSDGVDGWIVRGVSGHSRDFWREWRAELKKINADALLVADTPDEPSAWLAGDTFDTAVNHAFADLLLRFFRPGNNDYTPDQFFTDLENMQGRQPSSVTMAMLNPTFTADGERLLSRLLKSASAATKDDADKPTAPPMKTALERWQLASVFHRCYIGAPVIRFGDELGMIAGDAAAPMAWPETGKSDTDDRLAALGLAQLLGRIHHGLTPLRQGFHRRALWDAEHHLLAFTRLMPGESIIMVMNYGEKLEEATVPTSKSKHLLGVLEPQLRPIVEDAKQSKAATDKAESGVPEFRLTGSRQFANERGLTTLWVPPNSVKLVLVNDDEPR